MPEHDIPGEPPPNTDPGWTRRAAIGGLAAGTLGALGWLDDRKKAPDTGAARRGRSAEPGRATASRAKASRARADSPSRRVTIAKENARPGTSTWQVAQDPARWDRIRGYANRTSIAHGDALILFISTGAPRYTVTAYRMGFYGGSGGRQVWASKPERGLAQAPPRTDPVTNMRDAPWIPSLVIPIDDDWVPGSYLLKLVSSDGGESQIPLVVRDDEHPAPAVHIQHDVTTWQAYNLWGGASLYQDVAGRIAGRSTKVSFDRPYGLSGSGNFLGGVHEVAMLVESLGHEVTYSTSLDTHARPAACARPKVWISPAHDEYWSWQMRQGVTAARDAGVNFMILGANCMFRRIRLEDSALGPNRIQVNYRSAQLDPMTGVDDRVVTTSWREGPYPDPESSFTGVFYESNPVAADMVIADAGAWMFEGTGVTNGTVWPQVIGNEYDRVTPEVPTPETIQVLAHSPLRCRGHDTYADMTYYTTPAGAGVFSSGSIWFERHLAPPGNSFNPQIIRMVTNMLDVFAKGPAGLVHPAVTNLGVLGIRPGYLPTDWTEL